MLKTVLGLVFAVLFSAAAQAGTIKSVIGSLDPFQLWSDNSGDYLADLVGNNGLLDNGDVLVGQFSINSIEELALDNGEIFIPGGVGQEFTGAFAIKAVNKGSVGTDFTWDFVPVDAATLALLAGVLPANVVAEISSWAAGTMAAFYQDSALDYTRLGGADISSAFATAINGTRLFEMGFLGQAGEFWNAQARTDNVAAIGAISPPLNGGGFNLGVNKTAGDPDFVFTKMLGVDLLGSGSLLGTLGVNTPYDSFNNIDFVVNVTVVPEPASLSVFGLLACVVGARFRRKRVA